MKTALLFGAVWLAGMSLGVPSSPTSSPRTTQVLWFNCRSDLGRREITLFASGTLRVRQGLKDQETMHLTELGPDKLAAYVARLQERDLSETEERYHTVQGPWVERCRLELDLPDRDPEDFEFGRYDTLSLQLQSVVRIAIELLEEIDPEVGVEHLPSEYDPEIGDILRRSDGEMFEVVGFTADGRGVELSGLEQPLTIYLLKDELRKHFVTLESRRR